MYINMLSFSYVVYRFTLMESTWADTPAKRPSFQEIVIVLEQSKILLTYVDVVACYVCLFQSFIHKDT